MHHVTNVTTYPVIDQAVKIKLIEETVMATFDLSKFTPYRLVALARTVSGRLADAYAREDISIPEWRVLAVAAQAEQMSARDVVAMTPMDKMAVSRAITSLEKKALVKRTEHPEDARAAIVMLTEKGRAVFERIAKIALAFEAEFMSPLSAEEQESFANILSKLEMNEGLPHSKR